MTDSHGIAIRYGAWLPLAAFVLFACAPNLAQRVIEARGGDLHSYTRESDAEVFHGMKGTWRWELAYHVPDSFRWSISTWGDEQTLLFDGTTLRHRLGSAELPPLAADPPVRSQARWLAATALQILEDPRVAWHELAAEELPTGVLHGLRLRWLEGDSRPYDLFFDDRYLLVRARGDVSLEPMGSGLLDVSFSDFRDVDDFRLPFSATYHLDDTLILRESVRSWRPNPGDLAAGDFAGSAKPKARARSRGVPRFRSRGVEAGLP